MGGLTPSLSVWRHPRPREVAGRCIGVTDVAVDRRKSKRLAHRIRAWARRHGGPRIVVTSGLRRGADVGRWLARWGWHHRVDARLSELDFGAWEGRRWDAIGAAPVAAWCAQFEGYAPGGGESVAALLARCAAFIADPAHGCAVCIVGHAGWISAALYLRQPDPGGAQAGSWPAAVGYGARVSLRR